MRIREVLYAFLVLLLSNNVTAQVVPGPEILLSIDPPYSEYKKVYQQLNYSVPFKSHSDIRLQCYQYRGKDSVSLYNISFENVKLKKGIHRVSLNFDKNDKLHSADYSFLSVLSRFQLMPPGSYVMYLTCSIPDSNITLRRSFYWNIDSTLTYNASIRNNINNVFSAGKKLNRTIAAQNKTADLSDKQAKAMSQQLGHKVGKQNDLLSMPVSRDNKHYTALYHKEWFLGYYELETKAEMNNSIDRENMMLKQDQGALIHNDIEDFTSLSSQFRQLNSNDKKDDEVTGDIDVTGNFSNGQEPGSKQDNNYEEVRGGLHFNAVNMPFVVNGYYTTQDRGRKIKSSYLRFEYDVDKAKNELSKSMSGYKNAYNQTQSRGAGLSATCGQLISALYNEKSVIYNEISSKYGIDPGLLQKYNGNVNLMSAELDTSMLRKKAFNKKNTSEDVQATQAKLKGDEAEIRKDYEKAMALQAKIDKYKIYLDQYKRQQYFDSALNYQSIQNISNDPDASYKKMLHASQGLLPKGRLSTFVSGITKLEGGILNNYQSNYTMAGQNLKGGTLGYDLGFAELVLSAGKTEYISRDGNVDKYNTYMARLNYKPFKGQKLSLIYYGYSPGKQPSDSGSFFKSDATMTSYKEPVHIPSLLYEGAINKDLSVQLEGATSLKKTSQINTVTKNNSALKTSVIYNIPFAPLTVKAEWEHLGKHFENSALPFTKSGTERYTAATQVTLLKSFLTLGVQFNYLKQASLLSTGYNTKWGFDLKTNSKRYPNILISYKPFSTFRRSDDTFSIAQRPVIGSVFIGRGSYQLKRVGGTHRFTLTYNNSSSQVDTESYKTNTLQAGYIFMNKKNVFTTNAGWLNQPATADSVTSYFNTYFMNVGYSRNLNKNVAVNIGEDIAVAAFGLQRLATNLGGSYALQRLPIILHAQCRYAMIKQNAFTERQNLWYGQLGVNLMFKTRNVLMKKNKR